VEFNYILIWLTAISSISTIYQARGGERPTWLIYSFLILLILLVGYFQFPEVAGFVAGGVWTLTLLIPGLAYRRIDYYIARQRYSTARRAAALIAMIHPGQHARSLERLMQAIQLMRTGHTREAGEILERDSALRTPMAFSARSHLYAMSWQWAKVRDWIDSEIAQEKVRASTEGETFLAANNYLIPTYIRALCEMGELNRALQVYSEQRASLMTRYTTLLNISWLILLSFAGRSEELERLLANNLSSYTDPIKQFWRLTAKLANRDPAVISELEALTRCEDFATANGARSRLEYGVAPVAETLTPAAGKLLEEVVQDFLGIGYVAVPATTFNRRPVVTQTLIGVNVAVFLFEEISGGSENGRVLFRLGALVPEYMLLYGEWWRTFTSTFLHFGSSHLLMNMLGLYLLGPFLEFSLGRMRFAACYLLSGVLSMYALIYLWQAGLTRATLVVGASGSIMGLIGASAWVLFRIWVRRRSSLSSARLREILGTVALQGVFDMLTPQVSFAAHSCGLFLGAILGALLYRQPEFELPRVAE
jgi:rhomboid protease GluP